MMQVVNSFNRHNANTKILPDQQKWIEYSSVMGTGKRVNSTTKTGQDLKLKPEMVKECYLEVDNKLKKVKLGKQLWDT